MKKKRISRILGIVLSLVLLSSLVILPAPVSAGTQAWSTVSTPSATGLVLDNGNTFTGPFAIDINASAIYAGSNVGGTTPGLVRSLDGGRTWKAMTGLPALGGVGVITDIVTSSIDVNTVYVTDGVSIWRTTDALATNPTWTPRGNLWNDIGILPGIGLLQSGFITSIDVAYDGTIPYIYAGTSGFGVSALTGGVYGKQDTIFAPWTNLNIDTNRPVALAGLADVTEIVVDPVNFATTQLVMAVVTDRTANLTYVTSKFGGAMWNAAGNTDVTLPGVTVALYSASMWLPDDFSSTNMLVFVGIDSMNTAESDVFLVQFGTSPATDVNIGGTGTATIVSGLDGVGPAGTAQLLAAGSTTAAPTVPRIFRSTTGGVLWTPDTKAPIGGASPLLTARALPSVLMLSATDALVGTHGPGAGADNGVSISNDFGRVWNGISLLNGTITSIDDLELGSLFITTSGANDAVWRHDGTNWERVFLGTAAVSYIINASPAGDAIFVADIGSPAIMRSTDDGQTWGLTITAPGTVSGMVIVNANQYAVSIGTGVSTTIYNGAFWDTAAAPGVGTILTLAYDLGTGDLFVGGNTAGTNSVKSSTNFGTSWSSASNPLGAAQTAMSLAVSDDYGNDSKIYATGNLGGVWVRDLSATTPVWTQIDTAGTTVTSGVGLVTGPGGPDGMVYAADNAPSSVYQVVRLKANRVNGEPVVDTLTGVTTFKGLWFEAGSNILYTLSGNAIHTYTDTLNVNGTGVAISNVTAGSVTISWDALPNALTYMITVKTGSQATNVYTATNTWTGSGTSRTVTGLVTNTTYSVSVWAFTPVTSFLFSGAISFLTLPGIPGNAPIVGMLPAHGATNIPVMGPAFAWTAPGLGITSYDFQLTIDSTFTTITELNPALSNTTSVTVPYLVWETPLEYETAYYWRVRSVTGAGTSAWVTQIFTTVAEAPDLNVPPPPTPTITIVIPEFDFPEIPDIIIPDITLPPIEIPDITLPEIVLPDIILPPIVIPDITLPPIEIPEIVIPDITIPPLEQPNVIVNLPTPTITQVTSTIETPDTPAYVWAIIGIGAILSIAVITLIVKTRRIV